MDDGILNEVVLGLRQAGFTAAPGYPGQTFSGLSGPVAAVSIENVDCTGQTMAIIVEVASPAASGGAACQRIALEITQILHQMGAACRQGACSYSGSIKAYSVPIQAVFPCSPAGDTETCLTYKTFVWPQNPAHYQQSYLREPVYGKDDDGNTVFSGMGEMKRTISGEGCFTGNTAYSDFLALAALFAQATPGNLTHPIWGTYSCYFTALELTQSPQVDYVAYRFTFREADSTGAIPA